MENKTFFGQNDLYRFQFLSNEGADNLIRTWREEAGEAYEVSTNLIKKVEDMYACAIVQDEDGDQVLDVDVAIKSSEYQAFIKAICELQKVVIDGLSPTKRVAFFLNIYQCMYVHQFFKMVSEGQNSDTSSIFSKLSGYIHKQGSKQFHYNVAGKNYTLDEI